MEGKLVTQAWHSITSLFTSALTYPLYAVFLRAL